MKKLNTILGMFLNDTCLLSDEFIRLTEYHLFLVLGLERYQEIKFLDVRDAIEKSEP